MKLVRYGAPGQEKPAMLDAEGQRRDLSPHVTDISGAALLPATLESLRRLDPTTLLRLDGQPRLGPCVGSVGKIICVGLNYSNHAAESNMPVPSEPVLFMNPTSAIVGPNDDIEIGSGKSRRSICASARPCASASPASASNSSARCQRHC